MEPGPELDALVAEKVMGWVWDCESERWWDYTGDIGVAHEIREDWGEHCFSTDITAAWEVVEIYKDIWFVLHSRQHDGDWYCSVGKHSNDVIAPTAPHAICLAALKAVGNPP